MQCLGAGGTSERASCAFTDELIVIPAEGGLFPYDTTGEPSLGRSSCGGGGPQRVALLSLDRPSQVNFTITDNAYDTLIHLHTACDDLTTEIACNDDSDNLASALSFERLERGSYFLFLDGFAGRAGRASLRVTINPL